MRGGDVYKHVGQENGRCSGKAGIKVAIFAASAADAQDRLAADHPDVLLLGPQVRYLEGDFKKSLTIPVAVIDMQDYGLMKGDRVLQTALDLMPS